MLHKKSLLPLLSLLLFNAATAQPQNLKNPLRTEDGHPIILGDPYMYEHNGTYYLTGTYGSTNDGFPCYVSKDMIHWKFKGMLWEKQTNSWASGAFWAPEIIYYKQKFYLLYSGAGNKEQGLRLALAVSNNPDGPFTDLRAPLFDYGFGAIDGHIFVDKDQPYLYFSLNGAKDGYSFGIIYGIKLDKNLSRPIGDTVKLLEASQPWEKVNWAHNRCNEGPFVTKYCDRYYMTYSANHTFEPHYGIGYATASSPLGPWKKAAENPIASKDSLGTVSGIGHNSVLSTAIDHQKFIIYHTHEDPRHPDNGRRHANVGLLTFDDKGKLVFSADTHQLIQRTKQ